MHRNVPFVIWHFQELIERSAQTIICAIELEVNSVKSTSSTASIFKIWNAFFIYGSSHLKACIEVRRLMVAKSLAPWLRWCQHWRFSKYRFGVWPIGVQFLRLRWRLKLHLYFLLCEFGAFKFFVMLRYIITVRSTLGTAQPWHYIQERTLQLNSADYFNVW